MNPLRLGILIMFAVLLAGSLLYRFWPGSYDVSVYEAADIAASENGLSPGEFWHALQSPDPDLLIVDIRDTQAFKAGHLLDAVNIPMQKIVERRSVKAMKHRPVLIYGDTEADAHESALLLRMIGIEATPVNRSYDLLKDPNRIFSNGALRTSSEEKVKYNYPGYFKAFEITEAAPVEIKVPQPSPGGC